MEEKHKFSHKFQTSQSGASSQTRKHEDSDSSIEIMSDEDIDIDRISKAVRLVKDQVGTEAVKSGQLPFDYDEFIKHLTGKAKEINVISVIISVQTLNVLICEQKHSV